MTPFSRSCLVVPTLLLTCAPLFAQPVERPGVNKPTKVATAQDLDRLEALKVYAKGLLADVPRDLYWALGLGDSILAVCPSLDIVAVRLGTGSTRSQLPPFTNEWDKKVEGYFRLVARAVSEPHATRTTIPGQTGLAR